MKFAVVIEYRSGAETKNLAKRHHDYLASFLDSGRLLAAGPMAGDRGALWVLDADDQAGAEAIVRGDPFNEAGVFAAWHVHPLAYWSAKAHKGL